LTIELAKRVQNLQPSPTLALDKRANALKQKGQPIINLSVGQPDFDTPEHIRQAAHQAIDAGYSRYTAVDGLSELKNAIIQKFTNDNNIAYKDSQILVSSGAKHSIYNLLMVLLDDGDEVVIPAPYWVSYPEAVKLTGAKPVCPQATIDNHYKITAEQLNDAITERTKLVILNTPNNPTGMVYTHNELKALAEVLQAYPHVTILSDEIYEHLIWQDTFYNIVNVAPELKERTIIVNGVSKAYAMTGWRIGYAGGPESIIQAMKKLQSQSTSCANAVAQKAAEAALSMDQQPTRDMLRQFHKRHDLLYEGLQQLQHVKARASQGTFYSFINVEPAMHALGYDSDQALAEAILTDANVAMVPGSAFGAHGHMRLSFATSENDLNQALQRLNDFGL